MIGLVMQPWGPVWYDTFALHTGWQREVVAGGEGRVATAASETDEGEKESEKVRACIS